MINFVPHCTCQTPVPSNSSIQTSPTSFQIIPIPLKYGDPCVYKAYEKFVAETQIKNISHVLNFVYYENSLPYFSYLSDICIEVSDDLVIDAHKFDCVKQGDKEVCTCGYNMYKVDPLLSPSIIIESGHQYRTYRAVHGLDRRLVQESDKCKSGTHGHCTLENDVPSRKNQGEGMVLECREKHECRKTSRSMTNRNTSDEYGTCEKNDVNVEKFARGFAVSNILSKVLWLLTLMTLVALHTHEF
ncbi:hypothetical protein Fcan01_02862 [Folsomia candida]|uniref:Uncharacterized protein n=2 Tax=Folsomia candida TaxID=158441 RepID=A0A226F0T3_FOLCA|nr:hypothetical protein Fcan01_02862 [Folsomia candida]